MLYISTEDGVVGYVSEDLYWGRIGRVVRFALNVYLGLCDRVFCCRSLLRTLW